MAKIKNINFFKTGIESSVPVADTSQEKENLEVGVNCGNNQDTPSGKAHHEQTVENKVVVPRRVHLSPQLLQSVKTACVKLNEVGFPGLANDMAGLYKLAINKRFTVAFVGEFSRGKSTMINRILGTDILPAANLPTTAILTRIVYGAKPKMTVCGKDGKKIKEMSVKPESWDGLTAANFGEEEPEGSVIVEYPDKWLGEYAIDFIDTPGAGDLEEKRVRVIERSMVNADSAIIAIDANKALSQTEQLFIQQKIMSRGVPFVALAITKLDLVNADERAKVISYIAGKLKLIKISMPIVVADDNIEIPGFDGDKNPNVFVGVDKLKRLVIAWMTNENRRSLMERWLSINALAIINSARAFLLQQKEIIDAKDIEKEKLIRQRNNALSEVHVKWEALRTEMEARCKKCEEIFQKAAQEAGESMIENLQHEADRQPNPKDWLEKEYSYRVKRELSAISLSLDNLVAKRVTTDMHWLNNELNKQFKEIVGAEVSALMSREDFLPTVDDKAVKLNSLKDQSVKATVVSSVLTLGAALMLGVAGGAPLILATMGVGTAANLFSRKSLEKEGNRQREIVKELIAQQVPNVIKEASSDSATKIKIIYNDIISESHNTESRWMTAQRSLIRNSVESQGRNAKEQLSKRIATIEQLVTIFS